MESNQTKKEILLDTETAKIINVKAEKEHITPEQALDKMARTHLTELKKDKPTIFSPEQILDAIEKLQQIFKPCKNCSHNVKAEKPYIRMVNVKIPDSVSLSELKGKEGTLEYRKALAAQACRACIVIQALRNLPKEKQLAWIKQPDSNVLTEGLQLEK
jgi:hypothetical protein